MSAPSIAFTANASSFAFAANAAGLCYAFNAAPMDLRTVVRSIEQAKALGMNVSIWGTAHRPGHLVWKRGQARELL